MMTVTRDDILAELRKARAPVEEGLTMQEIADTLGLSLCSTWRRMRALLKAGEWRYVPVKRANVTGAVKMIPGYQPVKTKRK